MHHFGGALLGHCSEGIDHWQVRQIPHVAAINGRHILKRVKVTAPLFSDCGGIAEIVLVNFLYVRCVTAEKIRIATKGLVDAIGLTHYFADLRFPMENISWVKKPPATRLNRLADATVTWKGHCAGLIMRLICMHWHLNVEVKKPMSR